MEGVATPAVASLGVQPGGADDSHETLPQKELATLLRSVCAPPHFLLLALALKSADGDEIPPVVQAALTVSAGGRSANAFVCSVVERDVQGASACVWHRACAQRACGRELLTALPPLCAVRVSLPRRVDWPVLRGAFGPGPPYYLSACTFQLFSLYAQSVDGGYDMRCRVRLSAAAMAHTPHHHPRFLRTALGNAVQSVVKDAPSGRLEVSPLLADPLELGAAVSALAQQFDALVSDIARATIYFPRQLRAVCRHALDAIGHVSAASAGRKGAGTAPQRHGDGAGSAAGSDDVDAGASHPMGGAATMHRRGSSVEGVPQDGLPPQGEAPEPAAVVPAWHVLGRMVFSSWICPAVRYPWLYGILDDQPPPEAQRVLWYLADALEALSCGQPAPSTPFLACLLVTMHAARPALRDTTLSLACTTQSELDAARAAGLSPTAPSPVLLDGIRAVGDAGDALARAATAHPAQRSVKVGTLQAAPIAVSRSELWAAAVLLSEHVSSHIAVIMHDLDGLQQRYAAAGAGDLAAACHRLRHHLGGDDDTVGRGFDDGAAANDTGSVVIHGDPDGDSPSRGSSADGSYHGRHSRSSSHGERHDGMGVGVAAGGGGGGSGGSTARRPPLAHATASQPQPPALPPRAWDARDSGSHAPHPLITVGSHHTLGPPPSAPQLSAGGNDDDGGASGFGLHSGGGGRSSMGTSGGSDGILGMPGHLPALRSASSSSELGATRGNADAYPTDSPPLGSSADLPRFITTTFDTPRQSASRDGDAESTGSPWLSVSQRPAAHPSAVASIAAARRAAQGAASHGDAASKPRVRLPLDGGGGAAAQHSPSDRPLVVTDAVAAAGQQGERRQHLQRARSDQPPQDTPSSDTLNGFAAGVVGASFRALLESGQLRQTTNGGRRVAGTSHEQWTELPTVQERFESRPPSRGPTHAGGGGGGGRGGGVESAVNDSVARFTVGVSAAGLGDVQLGMPAPRRRYRE